jgi:hypothetical protein
MGQIIQVACPCGFSQSVKVSGGMRDFKTNATFPHYCKTCGLVDVNVTASSIECPTCHSQEVAAYGVPPISLPFEGYTSVQCREYSAPYSGNLCPQCQKMTLVFTNNVMMFD